jgi:hypothetical protein
MCDVLYTLDDANNVVATPDILAWANWMQDFKRRQVARDEVNEAVLSTVFMAISLELDSAGPIFETALFKDGFNVKILDRYDTWAAAEEGHGKHLGQLLSEKSVSS